MSDETQTTCIACGQRKPLLFNDGTERAMLVSNGKITPVKGTYPGYVFYVLQLQGVSK